MTSSAYRLKDSTFGSHSRLLGELPLDGHGASVVDVGGGEAYLSNSLSSRGFHVTCVAQPGSVAPAMSSAVKIVEADLNLSLPVLPDRFSYILCGDVLEHLVDPGAVLDWLRAALLPGGRLIASLPNSANIYVRLSVLAGRFPEHERGLFDKTHLHFFAWRNWAQLFDRSGFWIEKTMPTVIPFGLLFPSPAAQPIVWGLEGINYVLARGWKTLWAYQFVVVARLHE